MNSISEFLHSNEYLSLPSSARSLVLVFIAIKISEIVFKYYYDHLDDMKKLGIRLI